MLAKPRSAFLHRWLEQYKSFRSKGSDEFWPEHGSVGAGKTLMRLPRRGYGALAQGFLLASVDRSASRMDFRVDTRNSTEWVVCHAPLAVPRSEKIYGRLSTGPCTFRGY